MIRPVKFIKHGTLKIRVNSKDLEYYIMAWMGKVIVFGGDTLMIRDVDSMTFSSIDEMCRKMIEVSELFFSEKRRINEGSPYRKMYRGTVSKIEVEMDSPNKGEEMLHLSMTRCRPMKDWEPRLRIADLYEPVDIGGFVMKTFGLTTYDRRRVREALRKLPYDPPIARVDDRVISKNGGKSALRKYDLTPLLASCSLVDFHQNQAVRLS